MPETKISPLDALRFIAEKTTPCRECVKVHVKRTDERGFQTWADPDDGHSYQPMSPHEFARSIIGGSDARV